MSWSLLHMCHKGRKLECAHIPCEVNLQSLQFKLLMKALVELLPLFGILGGIHLHILACDSVDKRMMVLAKVKFDIDKSLKLPWSPPWF